MAGDLRNAPRNHSFKDSASFFFVAAEREGVDDTNVILRISDSVHDGGEGDELVRGEGEGLQNGSGFSAVNAQDITGHIANSINHVERERESLENSNGLRVSAVSNPTWRG